uniref:FKBP prolyl isomerase 15 n=1 Tax=Molossus molossus TaxID=27622 RepID=A0A7J8EDC9_MOLMO|nr:FKBP prolyl isomerase 15 [Molossus molossus]
MFGASDEDDTDFLSPSGGARLASLFGRDQTAADHGNEFFQYTAPKQPKKVQGTAATGKRLELAPIKLVERINSLPQVIYQVVHPWSVWPSSLLVVHASLSSEI